MSPDRAFTWLLVAVSALAALAVALLTSGRAAAGLAVAVPALGGLGILTRAVVVRERARRR